MEQKRFPKFAERFAELRGNRTQDEFSVFLGISRPTVGFYENGTRLPDALVLRQICERCQVSADWLLGLSDEKSLDGEIRQICNYTGLSEEAIELLADLKESESGYMSRIADYILKYNDGEFFLVIVEYLSACVWGICGRGQIGLSFPSEQRKAQYEELQREHEKKTGKGFAIMNMLPLPIMAPIEEEEESLAFSRVIKELPRIYDSFKKVCEKDTGFIDAVVRQYVEDYGNYD